MQLNLTNAATIANFTTPNSTMLRKVVETVYQHFGLYELTLGPCFETTLANVFIAMSDALSLT